MASIGFNSLFFPDCRAKRRENKEEGRGRKEIFICRV
jgi:hypothetical protein